MDAPPLDMVRPTPAKIRRAAAREERDQGSDAPKIPVARVTISGFDSSLNSGL